MLATASSMECSSGSDSDLASLSSLSSLGSSPVAGKVTGKVTVHASAKTASDTDLTNLGWLQKPGVLTSMCTALTGPGTQTGEAKAAQTVKSTRKPRQPKASGEGKVEAFKSRSHPRTSDKMVNVILNVRNRKYNGEDARKPPLSFACMIFMAVESSPTKTLPVKGIYDWVMWKFPYYQDAPPGWKNSVRHNLSLNKCFKKVDRYTGKSSSACSKGGLWTVDPDYRRSLLAALKRSPYHPYHSFFSPPLSPSSSSSSLDDVDPAERDAALTMCMIGGNSEGAELGSDLLHGIYHDHCYTRDPPLPPPPAYFTPPLTQQVTVKLTNKTAKRPSGLTLDEIVAAAEMILAQDDEPAGVVMGSDQSSDEGLGGEVDTDMDEEDEEEEEGLVDVASCAAERLGDSGYAGSSSPSESPPGNIGNTHLMSSLDEMGVDALLCLATAASQGASSTVTAT